MLRPTVEPPSWSEPATFAVVYPNGCSVRSSALYDDKTNPTVVYEAGKIFTGRACKGYKVGGTTSTLGNALSFRALFNATVTPSFTMARRVSPLCSILGILSIYGNN